MDLLPNVFEALNVEPLFHSELMRALCSEVFNSSGVRRENTDDDKKRDEQKRDGRVLEWLGEMADLGIDIQNISPTHDCSGLYCHPAANEFCDRFDFVNWRRDICCCRCQEEI